MIRTLEQRLVYENAWVRVFDDRVSFPDGHEGTYYYSRWKAPYGVGIVAVAKGCALLIRSFRYSDRSYSLEIPLGFGQSVRSPREQAQIELYEETGLVAASVDDLLCLGLDYRTHIFLARASGEPSLAQQEATEAIAGFEWVPIQELTASALAARGVYEPISMAALLAAGERLGNDDLLGERPSGT